MTPLLGILAAPAASAALDVAGKALECSAQPFAAMLEAAKRQFDQPPANSKPLLANAPSSTDNDEGAFDIQSMLAAIGL